MSGKPAKAELSDAEKSRNQLVADKLLPGADRLLNTQGGNYVGTRLGDESQTTLDQRNAMLRLAPQLAGRADINLDSLQGFMNPDVQSVDDIFNNAPDLRDLYQQTTNRENIRSRVQINNLIDMLGRESGEQFGRNILPQIQDQAAAAGQFTSSKAGLAEGVAAADLGNDLNLQIGGLLQSDLARQDALREAGLNRAYGDRQFDITSRLGARQGDLTNALTASGQFNSALAGRLAPEEIISGIGRERDIRQQLGLEDRIQEYEAPYMNMRQRLGDFATILSGSPISNPQVTPGQGSPLLGALGGAGTGAGIAQALSVTNPAAAAAITGGSALIGLLGT